MPAPPKKAPTMKAIRTTTGSTEKYRPIPAATPEITRSLDERMSRLETGGSGVGVVAVVMVEDSAKTPLSTIGNYP
jgi:hypothetical protein